MEYQKPAKNLQKPAIFPPEQGNAVDIELHPVYIVGMFFLASLATVFAYILSPQPFKRLVMIPFFVKSTSAIVVVIYYVGLESLREYGPLILRFALLLSEFSQVLFLGVVYWYFFGINPIQKFGALVAPIVSKGRNLYTYIISKLWKRGSP
jgi:hypothetical protein